MGRLKGKRIKQKQESPKSKRAFPSKPQFVKKPRKHIYYVNFRAGEKTNQEIKSKIDSLDFTKINNGELPDMLMKVTFVARKSAKEQQAFTNIYRMDDLEEVPDAVGEIWDSITTRPPKNGKDYMKRINKLRGYITSIIIDFETAGN